VALCGVENFTVEFLAGHFLFTYSDTFAVGCILSHKTPRLAKQQQQTSDIKGTIQIETVN